MRCDYNEHQSNNKVLSKTDQYATDIIGIMHFKFTLFNHSSRALPPLLLFPNSSGQTQGRLN